MNTASARLRSLRLLFVACALGGLAACGSGGGGSTSSTGTLKLGIADAPVDAADAVVVQFTGVELKPVNGQAFSIDFAQPKSLDLIALQGTNRAMLLDGEQVPAGNYEWMRLKVNVDPNSTAASYVQVGGATCGMRIPSGAETGLKLIRGFTVAVGAITDFTIEFDVRRSLIRPPGQQSTVETCSGAPYMLKPVLRIVDNLQVGSIAGTVDPTLISQQCTDASTTAQVTPGNIYLFGPYDTTPPVPDDYDGIPNDPNGADAIASAKVKLDGSGNYGYTIGFVAPGNYVAAYTCSPDQPDVDASDPNSGEVVTFTPAAGTTLTVTANQATTVNFAP